MDLSKDVLTVNYAYLVDHVKADDVLPRLVSARLVGRQICQEIENLTDAKKVQTLLDEIYRSPDPEWFVKFTTALSDTDESHKMIAEKLQAEYENRKQPKSVTTSVSRSWTESVVSTGSSAVKQPVPSLSAPPPAIGAGGTTPHHDQSSTRSQEMNRQLQEATQSPPKPVKVAPEGRKTLTQCDQGNHEVELFRSCFILGGLQSLSVSSGTYTLGPENGLAKLVVPNEALSQCKELGISYATLLDGPFYITENYYMVSSVLYIDYDTYQVNKPFELLLNHWYAGKDRQKTMTFLKASHVANEDGLFHFEEFKGSFSDEKQFGVLKLQDHLCLICCAVERTRQFYPPMACRIVMLTKQIETDVVLFALYLTFDDAAWIKVINEYVAEKMGWSRGSNAGPQQISFRRQEVAGDGDGVKAAAPFYSPHWVIEPEGCERIEYSQMCEWLQKYDTGNEQLCARLQDNINARLFPPCIQFKLTYTKDPTTWTSRQNVSLIVKRIVAPTNNIKFPIRVKVPDKGCGRCCASVVSIWLVVLIALCMGVAVCLLPWPFANWQDQMCPAIPLPWLWRLGEVNSQLQEATQTPAQPVKVAPAAENRTINCPQGNIDNITDVSFAILVANENEYRAVFNYFGMGFTMVTKDQPYTTAVLNCTFDSDPILAQNGAVEQKPAAGLTQCSDDYHSITINGKTGIIYQTASIGSGGRQGAMITTVQLLKVAKERRWPLEIIFVVGCTGGHGKGVENGQVIVPTKVIEYNRGKFETGDDGQPKRIIKPEMWLTSEKWWKSVMTLSIRDGGENGRGIKMAGGDYDYCGDFVVKDKTIAEDLKNTISGNEMIGIEMEGVGVATAIHVAETLGFGNVPEYLIIKGISDNADGNKGATAPMLFFGTEYDNVYPDDRQVMAALQSVTLAARAIHKRMEWKYRAASSWCPLL